MSKPCGLLVFLCFLAGSANEAVAQTSPFAGTWSGTNTITGSQTCTFPPASSITTSCTGSAPWTGTIDPQGNFTLNVGALTITCDGVSTTAPTSGPELLGQVPSNGALPFPGSTFNFSDSSGTFSQSCAASTIQFSSSSMSGGYLCTSSDTLSAGGLCTDTNQVNYTGTRTSTGTTVTTPVFPITVTSSITPTIANATAQIQPPAQVVGTQASVFVFAHVRQSALSHTAPKRALSISRPIQSLDGPTPDPCVLAQLNSNGQLTAASGSTLQAYTTGVLTSQTQSVSILNNVSTPNVAGASFYVGYGATSSAMLSSGIYQGAVSVQGTSACSAALLTGAAPNSPSALSGLWWNPLESGWGISFTQRSNIVFGAWYTYDSSGNPKWYVAPNCPLPSGVTGTSGTCTGSLYEVTGPTFFGATFNPSLVNVAAVGSLTVNYQNASTATMTYTLNNQNRTVPITRQVFGSGTTPPAVDYTDLWWGGQSESGWGMVITQQYGVMFLAWYVYDSAGKPMWYVAPDCVVVGSSCSGSLYRTTGPPLGPTFNPNAVQVFPAGTIGVSFSDANNATVSYTVNGVSSTKTITRQVF